MREGFAWVCVHVSLTSSLPFPLPQLHGQSFWVMAEGPPNSGPYDPNTTPLVPKYVRDVAAVQKGSYLVIRFTSSHRLNGSSTAILSGISLVSVCVDRVCVCRVVARERQPRKKKLIPSSPTHHPQTGSRWWSARVLRDESPPWSAPTRRRAGPRAWRRNWWLKNGVCVTSIERIQLFIIRERRFCFIRPKSEVYACRSLHMPVRARCERRETCDVSVRKRGFSFSRKHSRNSFTNCTSFRTPLGRARPRGPPPSPPTL